MDYCELFLLISWSWLELCSKLTLNCFNLLVSSKSSYNICIHIPPFWWWQLSEKHDYKIFYLEEEHSPLLPLNFVIYCLFLEKIYPKFLSLFGNIKKSKIANKITKPQNPKQSSQNNQKLIIHRNIKYNQVRNIQSKTQNNQVLNIQSQIQGRKY